jgi:Tfp pilus assembly protein PilZ
LIYNDNLLSKDPIKRYNEINKILEKIEIAKILMQPFPKTFTKADFDKLSNLKKHLQDLLSKTYPQYVKFSIINGENIKITLNNKQIKLNEKYFLPEGEYNYIVHAKGKCPIKGSITLEKFKNEEIDIDLESQNLPKIIFLTDKEPQVILDGNVVKLNVPNTLSKCEGKVIYIAKYANQTKKGDITLEANLNKTIELDFLTAQELDIFNDVKTKVFRIKSGEKISDTLTPKVSPNLKFEIESKPQHGSLELDQRGTFVYTADKEYIGNDIFEYIVVHNDQESPKKVVKIIIEPTITQKAKKVTKDINNTINETAKQAEEKIEEVKKEAKEVSKSFNEEKYKKFKAYIMTLNPIEDKEKIKKLAKKYPEYFNRFLEDMKK